MPIINLHNNNQQLVTWGNGNQYSISNLKIKFKVLKYANF